MTTRYRVVRALVRLVVLGGGAFFVLAVVPALVDAYGWR